MPNKRFSKATLAAYCSRRVENIENAHRLKPWRADGTSQLAGRPLDTCVAYGEREALMSLMEEFNLEFGYAE